MRATTTILTALAFGGGILALCSAALPASEVAEFDRIRQVHAGNANKLFENVLLSKKAAPLQRGFAQLWLTRDLKEGNPAQASQNRYHGIVFASTDRAFALSVHRQSRNLRTQWPTSE